MSSAKLSSVIQNRVIKILERDLREELNTLVPELEIDESYTVKFLMVEYNLSKAKAQEAFRFIISDISSNSIFTHKKGVPGKPFVFSPTKSKAQDKYRAVSDWKRSISNKIEKRFGIEDFSSKFHLGHGSSSVPTVGYRALKAGSYLAGRAGAEAMIGVLNSSPLIKGFEVDAKVNTVFTKAGKFKKRYRVRLKLQHGEENLSEATEEKLLNKKLIEELSRIAVEEETSPSSIKLIQDNLDRVIKGKKQKNISTVSKAKVSKKNKLRGTQGKIPPLRDAKGRYTSPANLQSLIQAQLTEKVKENMGTGGSLENRTGRFAESVTVTNVTQSRQASVTAFYTYMKYPYQTFERGFKQGSTRRDPRLLISKSIREIATEAMGAKLNIRTRRV